jgi:hypothetical protein
MEIQPVPAPVQETKIDVSTHEGPPLYPSRISPQGYDLSSCATRFLSAATFGLFLNVLIFCIYGAAVLLGCRPGTMGLLYTLIEVPIIWGILGIFFFSEMLELAGVAIVRTQSIRRWYRLHR